jgi:hypothetical protein
MAAGVAAAFAQKIPAEISVDTSGGFARIVYRFDGDVDANVRMSNGILVISFNVPVEASTDRLSSAGAGYVSAARRDPDGKGLRRDRTWAVPREICGQDDGRSGSSRVRSCDVAARGGG